MSDVVAGAFDDLRFADYRFLAEAAKRGPVHAILWPDEVVAARIGKPPKFPLAEREYVLRAVRYVDRVTVAADAPAGMRVVTPDDFPAALLKSAPGVPPVAVNPPANSPTGKKVIVTGCFDYFHSGHVRFAEECGELGDLYVSVGNDENVRQLKGDGHPLFPASERAFIVGSIRTVTQAFIATGMGWMDAEPDIEKLRPDIYAVNQDGDKPEKRAFCQRKGIDYVVLKREPKIGLPRRASTALRGF